MNEWDQALIKRYLHFYEALHNGDRVPETIAQKHFLAVCQGRAEPQTQHEIAYLRFISSGKVRWSHILGQFGSKVKVYSVA